ncbi:MAG: NAD(P)H-hydrate dehydratase [bacterium]
MQFPDYPLYIVTGSVMAELDRKSIEERGISGLFLMERAGESVAQHLISIFPPDLLHQTVILCGKGNNGGDGFVIARHLYEQGYSPRTVLLGRPDELRGDALRSYHLLSATGANFNACHNEEELIRFVLSCSSSRVWVDALLGTGSRGAPRGLYRKAIEFINERQANNWVISVDIPTGVDSNTGNVADMAVEADYCFTMGLPKVGHVLPPGMDYCRNLVVLNIGFPIDLLKDAVSDAEMITAQLVHSWIPQRSPSSHKGSQGHLLVVAGSRGMTGAALMCAKAAVLTGSGLVTTACPTSLLSLYASGVWEMLTLPVPETEAGSFAEAAWEHLSEVRKISAAVIGPGMGRHPETQAFIKKFIKNVQFPLVVDGDGLNALSQQDIAARVYPTILTPHPGEMARLCDTHISNIQSDRWGYATKLAQATGSVVLLKGRRTVVASETGGLYVNPTGTSAMASGGMGDVLAGMIASLLGQGVAPLQAAAAGAYLHGLAAEIQVRETGAETVCATQVIDRIQPALAQIRPRKRITATLVSPRGSIA